MTVHHTAVRLDRNADAPGQIRGHQAFHQQSGWADLAYHYMVDANGNIYEGRPFSAPGDTFTNYDPAGHFLVCCEGNFDQQDLPEAQVASLAAMLAWGSDAFGISPDTIAGHRDYASTTCPGTTLAGIMENGSLQAAVVALLESGGVELTEACGDEGAALVAAIEAGTA
ncbi:MAG: N-acetylmuramoyl-L-alanine amidase [Acidimicrobiia bacterium]|nr:peptidoglycan recognition protein family protein [Acidimicrobiia bacterium]NNF63577.1 N-acetylmuramoyl-L-alanine amidase [Acidimicrobiia bacterium]